MIAKKRWTHYFFLFVIDVWVIFLQTLPYVSHNWSDYHWLKRFLPQNHCFNFLRLIICCCNFLLCDLSLESVMLCCLQVFLKFGVDSGWIYFVTLFNYLQLIYPQKFQCHLPHIGHLHSTVFFFLLQQNNILNTCYFDDIHHHILEILSPWHYYW